MRIVDFSLRRRVTVSMVAVAMLLFGAVAFTRLPVNLMPDLSFPSLTVETRLPGAAPGEVEALITRPIEELVGIAGGVQRLTSVSRPGISQVTLEFGWGRDMDFAALDVRQKLDIVALPRSAERPVLLRFDPSNDPVVRLYLSGGDSLYQLRYVAEEVIKKDLESTEGVAAIKVHGGYEEEIQVRIDEGRLALLGLTINELNARLLAENLNQAGGSLYEAEARYLVRARNEFRNLDDIRETVLLNRDGRQVTVDDVAEVVRTHRQREVITRFDGVEAVELAVYKEGDANTVKVARSVHARLGAIDDELPENVEISAGTDQSRFIEASIREVLSNALIGGIVAILILMLFLKDLRTTLIIGISIPISVVTTFFLMYRTGTTLNIMSLGGLALGVGMLVDSAIVVLEAIVKRREAGEDDTTAASKGASEVGHAVIASTLTTVAVFLPVVFLEGVAAQLFRDQALTVSFSLIAALAVSLTLIPMMVAVSGRRDETETAGTDTDAGRIRRAGRFVLVTIPSFVVTVLRTVLGGLLKGLALLARPVTAIFDRAMAAITAAYPRLLETALRHRLAVIAVAVLAFAGSVSLVPKLGMDLIPPFSQGEFSFKVQLPEGTPLEVTDRFIASLSDLLDEDATVESFSSIAGGAGLSLAATGTEGENTARIQVRMIPGSGPADENAVIENLRSRLTATEGLRFDFERASFFSFRTPVEVEIYSDSIEELHDASARIVESLHGIPGLVDLRSSAEMGNPEVQVRFDREQLSRLGLDLATVASTVRTKVQGDVATRFTEGDREIDIRVRALEQGDARVEDIHDLIVGHVDGRPIFLKSVASVTLTHGPTEIRRIGQKRAAVVGGNLSGRDMGAVAADVRTALDSLALPMGVSAALSGQEEELQQSFRSLALAMGLAIFLVYLVMASQFESFLHPFVIIFTLPLGAIGVILALFVTGHTVNVVAIIGAVMLAGIVVNNAIVLIDAVNQRRRAGAALDEALVDAGLARLRPILMTSATTIFGLMPMALGLGEGAELRAPLAVTVIGGLAVATALTLIVIPVVYSLLAGRRAMAVIEEPEKAAGGPFRLMQVAVERIQPGDGRAV
ncbi:MAG: efflux RND transporter permease subunit [Thermoanaerobaculales bacterium]|jgi:HAE1 family hydrophobic/amphiphilic exporter-1|nr:efflux RND transporter permease subunit [Thermoanaerobaculales bacterium]